MPHKVVLQANDAGFFSFFTAFVSYLVWERNADPEAMVLPDWRMEKLLERFHHALTNFCYGKVEDGNIWLKLFEPLPYADLDPSIYNSEQDLYTNAEVRADWNVHREPTLNNNYGYDLYKRPDFYAWRQWYHFYYVKFIRPKAHIVTSVNNFAQENFYDKTIVSALIRHPSHAIEQPGGVMPSLEDFLAKVNETIAKHQISSDELVVFIVTDTESVLDFFQQHFPQQLRFMPNIQRITREEEARFQQLSKEEQGVTQGHQLQQLAAQNPERWSVRLAEEILINALLIAKTDYFIHTNSNIAKAVSFMNPALTMIYCEDIASPGD